MSNPVSAYHSSLLQIIYDAYDRVYDIAGHRWHPFKYYIPEFKVSNLFGHYVRSLDEFKDVDPAMIPLNQYMTKAAPLANALNTILEQIIPEDDWDIYAICEGRSSVFRHPDPRDRCMAVFYLIDKKYPRAEYMVKPVKKSTPPPKPVETAWLPYKD